MRIQPIEPEKKKIFFVSVAITVGLVSAGWIFSLRDLWLNFNSAEVVDFSQVNQVKEDVQGVAADFKNNMESTASEVGATLQQTTEVINQGVEQRQNAMEIIGEKMKTELDNQAYEETQKNN